MKIKKFLSEMANKGYSVIPVDDHKQPIVAWKKYQAIPMVIEEVQKFIDNGHQNFALVCGVNGLEAIDIDTKNLDSENEQEDFLQDIRKNLPTELWAKLVIQKTPSGGFHLLYRCQEVSVNQHLAKNRSRKPIIETRGNGGYVLICPSKGYTVIQGDLLMIPEITAEERTKLLEACKAMTQLEKLQKGRAIVITP
ncbi:MAG: bifunctional DNA primase/polymerase [Saprospiraceae bacterium]|nr:bifunctional DNA primase/polymerase [Saprospiraceae bacterium]